MFSFYLPFPISSTDLDFFVKLFYVEKTVFFLELYLRASHVLMEQLQTLAELRWKLCLLLPFLVLLRHITGHKFQPVLFKISHYFLVVYERNLHKYGITGFPSSLMWTSCWYNIFDWCDDPRTIVVIVALHETCFSLYKADYSCNHDLS